MYKLETIPCIFWLSQCLYFGLNFLFLLTSSEIEFSAFHEQVKSYTGIFIAVNIPLDHKAPGEASIHYGFVQS